jgi:hypothetical protein
MHNYYTQIAPQRSTQYGALAEHLAPLELQLSPFGARVRAEELQLITLGGQRYLRVRTDEPIDELVRADAGRLAATRAWFESRDEVGGVAGPWLRPLEIDAGGAWPEELVSARRYKGKTNELFTRFLCNVALHSSAYANGGWKGLRVLDPLAGGGTTLFVALTLGADAFGVEKSLEDVQGTAAFFRQYCREAEIDADEKEERMKGVGRRWRFTIGEQTLCCAAGDAADAAKLLNGFKRPNLIVTDLPYGVQHNGPLLELLERALPAWEAWLEPGGAVAFSWDATRLTREEMIAHVERSCGLRVRRGGPYDAMAHAVDRVIKRREVVVMG